MAEINTDIWDALYLGGNYLHYPSEAFVQLYFRTLGKDHKAGSFLDHGCGSGNNSEFLARRGWSVTGSDVSAKALELHSKRMMSVGGQHTKILVKSELPLGSQLGQFDHVLCWDCLCYNHMAKARADASDLAAALNPGGYIFINMPTIRHEFAESGRKLNDGSYENRRIGTRQEGAIMAIPETLDDLISWFGDLQVIERGYFTFDFGGFREFMVFVGRKANAK